MTLSDIGNTDETDATDLAHTFLNYFLIEKKLYVLYVYVLKKTTFDFLYYTGG